MNTSQILFVHGYFFGSKHHENDLYNSLVYDLVLRIYLKFDIILLLSGWYKDGHVYETVADLQCAWLKRDEADLTKFHTQRSLGLTQFTYACDTYDETWLACLMLERLGLDPFFQNISGACMDWHAERVGLVYRNSVIHAGHIYTASDPKGMSASRSVYESLARTLTLLDPRGTGPLFRLSRHARNRRKDLKSVPVYRWR